jgi:lipopolysaccharide biosynthesis glycosyltransferase
MSSTQINSKSVVVIATENYLQELAITVFNVTKYLPDDIDLIVLVDFDSPFLDKIKTLHKNIKIRKINKDRYKHLSFENLWRKWQYNCGYRFEIFTLSEYEKICYMDLDIIIKDNFIDIFNFEGDACFCLNAIGSIPEFKKAMGFNAGICTVTNKYLTQEMVDRLISIAARKDYTSDEAVLFSFFGNKYTVIPREYNTLSAFINKPEDYDRAKIVHFIGHLKPWNESVSTSFDEYVIRLIGLSNCRFLYAKYREYKQNTLQELKKRAIY